MICPSKKFNCKINRIVRICVWEEKQYLIVSIFLKNAPPEKEPGEWPTSASKHVIYNIFSVIKNTFLGSIWFFSPRISSPKKYEWLQFLEAVISKQKLSF